MNEGSRAMTMFFLKTATVTLTLAYHNYWSNPESDLSPWPSNHKLFFVTAVKIYH